MAVAFELLIFSVFVRFFLYTETKDRPGIILSHSGCVYVLSRLVCIHLSLFVYEENGNRSFLLLALPYIIPFFNYTSHGTRATRKQHRSLAQSRPRNRALCLAGIGTRHKREHLAHLRAICNPHQPDGIQLHGDGTHDPICTAIAGAERTPAKILAPRRVFSPRNGHRLLHGAGGRIIPPHELHRPDHGAPRNPLLFCLRAKSVVRISPSPLAALVIPHR